MHNSERNRSEKGQAEHAFQHIVSIECSIDDISAIEDLHIDRPVSQDSTRIQKTSPAPVAIAVEDGNKNETKAAESKDEQRIYRIDHQACKFQPSRLLTEPQIHVSVKSNPAAKAVNIEEIVQHKKAVRISQGAEVQQIVVSPYESIDTEDLRLTLEEKPVDETPDLGDFASHNTVVSGNAASVQLEITSETAETKTDEAVDEQTQDSTQGESVEPVAEVELKPAWAVNSFRWPDTITRLCTHHKSAFERLVQSLHLNVNRAASRIGVIHSRAGQGATTLATCLANVLASSNAKVLLADMDLENPDLEEVANIKLKNGWQQLLDVDESINEFLVRDSSSSITLMPLRRQVDLTNSRPGLLKVIKSAAPSLASQFDFSVYDIGNVRNLMIDENCHVGFLDGAVIVSDSSGNESSAVAIYEKLIAAGVPAVVIAENFRSKARSAA